MSLLDHFMIRKIQNFPYLSRCLYLHIFYDVIIIKQQNETQHNVKILFNYYLIGFQIQNLNYFQNSQAYFEIQFETIDLPNGFMDLHYLWIQHLPSANREIGLVVKENEFQGKFLIPVSYMLYSLYFFAIFFQIYLFPYFFQNSLSFPHLDMLQIWI